MLLVMVPLCGHLPNFKLPLLGRIPLTLCLSIGLIAFMGWGLIFSCGLAIVTGVFPTGSAMKGVMMVAIAASLYTSITFSQMLLRLFQDTSSEMSEERFIGLNGTVVSLVIPRFSVGRAGQLNVADKTGVSGVAAVTPDWAEELAKTNDRVQIIDFDRERNLFIVLKAESDDYLRWISGQNSSKRQAEQ